MTEKYKVAPDLMEALNKWRDEYDLNAVAADEATYLTGEEITKLPEIVQKWWIGNTATDMESNRRLIAIIRHLNREDVFEVEKLHMFVVRSIRATSMGKHGYLFDLTSIDGVPVPSFGTQSVLFAAKFDSREAAEAWVTSGYKVVEIDEEYQEVDEDLPF